MPQPERFETLVLGSGNGGMYLAWHMARSGRRTAVVERRWIGGSCPNINCLPSKNEIWSGKVAELMHHAANFGAMTGSVAIDMAKVRQRKRDMVEGLIAMTLQEYKASGVELIMGVAHFVAPKTLEVRLNDGGTRVLAGDQVFVNIGTHAAIPSVPGLDAAGPLTNIEALELDYVPPHLIVLVRLTDVRNRPALAAGEIAQWHSAPAIPRQHIRLLAHDRANGTGRGLRSTTSIGPSR